MAAETGLSLRQILAWALYGMSSDISAHTTWGAAGVF